MHGGVDGGDGEHARGAVRGAGPYGKVRRVRTVHAVAGGPAIDWLTSYRLMGAQTQQRDWGRGISSTNISLTSVIVIRLSAVIQ